MTTALVVEDTQGLRDHSQGCWEAHAPVRAVSVKLQLSKAQ
jgi:hypothetical protein